MKEAKITAQTSQLLLEMKKQGWLWYYKVSDRFTSGIADFVGHFIGGRAFHVELKAPNEKLRKLQAYTLYEANKCHAKVLGTDNFEEVESFIREGIKEGKRKRKPYSYPLDHFLTH